MLISTIINVIICGVIIILGLIVLVSLFVINKSFIEIKSKFKSINITKSNYDETVGRDGEIITKGYSENRIDQGKLEENRDKYFKQYANYVVASQMIAIFPLLGILGTVLGLVLGGGIQDATKLMSGLSMALLTTLFGLLASIILKTVDAVMVGRNVNLIDSEFEKADAIINRQIIRSEIKSASRNS